jgi:cell division protein FtsA
MIFDGSVRYTSVIGLGGQHLTNDISQGLRTSAEQAEIIKKKYGVAMQSLIDTDELIKVAGVGGRKDREVSRVLLSGIIQPRMEEMLQLAVKEMEKSKIVEFLGAGIVITGGAALLEGIVELAERVTGIPVKIGKPIVSGGLVESVDSPMYATGVGLIQFALKFENEIDKGDKLGFNWILDRLRSFIENLFK